MLGNYYRRITELLPTEFKKIGNSSKEYVKLALKGNYLAQFLLLFFLLLFIFLSIFGALSYFRYEDIKAKRAEAQKELSYWEGVIVKNPTAPDSYYNAALYAASLNDKQKAIDFLDKALSLDPNFKDAKEFEEKISE